MKRAGMGGLGEVGEEDAMGECRGGYTSCKSTKGQEAACGNVTSRNPSSCRYPLPPVAS